MFVVNTDAKKTFKKCILKSLKSGHRYVDKGK